MVVHVLITLVTSHGVSVLLLVALLLLVVLLRYFLIALAHARVHSSSSEHRFLVYSRGTRVRSLLHQSARLI